MSDIRYPLTVWNLESPLTEAALAGEPPPTCVQWRTEATERDHRLLNAYLASHPDTALNLMPHLFRSDPEVLRYYPDVAQVSVAFGPVSSFESLRYLRRDLLSLTLAEPEKRNISLRPLGRFEALQHLALNREGTDVDVVWGLKSLKRLSFWNVRLPSLAGVSNLVHLRRLDLSATGVTNIDVLDSLAELVLLTLRDEAKLVDISVLGRLTPIEALVLANLKQVESLPSLRACTRLGHVQLERLRIRELRGVADAPRLEKLAVVGAPKLDPAALEAFIGHPSLRAATIVTRRKSTDRLAREILPLPQVPDAIWD